MIQFCNSSGCGSDGYCRYALCRGHGASHSYLAFAIDHPDIISDKYPKPLPRSLNEILSNIIMVLVIRNSAGLIFTKIIEITVISSSER